MLDGERHPVFYAHRGAAAEQPENTLPSFRRALELGAHALETDLHMTLDGRVVVSHDPTGARMCNVDAAFRASLLADVRTWDAGWGFVDDRGERPFANRGYRVPTLEELLLELPDVEINVDLKQSEPPMVTEALRVIRHLRATDRVTVASFHLRTLLAVRAAGYEGRTSLSQPEVAALVFSPGPVFRIAPMTGAVAQIPTRVGPITLASRRMIRKCHRLGLDVHFWTINDPAEAARLLDLGADGIMTDDPAAIAPVFAERGCLAPDVTIHERG